MAASCVALLLALTACAAAALSPPQWNSLEFAFVPARKNFTSAAEYCVSLGGSLATFRSKAENDYLLSILPAGRTNTWIGATRSSSSAPFAFIDGTPFSHAVQALLPASFPSEPQRNCLSIDENKQWKRRECVKEFPFACKRNGAQGTTTTTTTTATTTSNPTSTCTTTTAPTNPTTTIRATVTLYDLSRTSNITGTIVFVQLANQSNTTFEGNVTGLTDGLHGFHIHDVGDLSGGCATALGHYNPLAKQHGGPQDSERHMGDLGNIQSTGGVALVSGSDREVRLHGEYSVIGRAVVVHALPDDLGLGGFSDSKTTGHAGARVACGVIGLRK